MKNATPVRESKGAIMRMESLFGLIMDGNLLKALKVGFGK